MQIVLSDHDCEGQAQAIYNALIWLGLTPLIPIDLRRFHEVGLHIGADDETIWRLCQEQGYLLLTGNRSTKAGSKSLERVISRLVTPHSLPVLTIGDLQRVLHDREYCERCAVQLAEIVLDLEIHRGTTRLFIPGEAVPRKS